MSDLQQALAKLDLSQAPDVASQIIDIVTNAYTGSPTFRAMLDAVPVGEQIVFLPSPNGENRGGIIPEGRFVLYAPSEIAATSSIDSNGNVFNWSASAIYIHEMIHAMTGDTDPDISDFSTPNTDYVGDVVRAEQDILEELGFQNIRNSYEAVIENTDIASLDLDVSGSLTFGNSVGLVLVDRYDWNDMNLSDRIDDLLLVGLGGSDVIKGGMSKDYIYGGDGGDILMGHGGSDRLLGNAGDDILVGGEGAPIDLTALNLSQANTDWDDNVRDFLSGGADNDTYLIYSDRTYFGGPDSWDFVLNAFNTEVDFIDGADASFDAYFQFKFGDEVKNAHITAADLENPTPVEWADGLYDLGVEVTYSWGGEEVTQTVKGDLLATGMLLLTVAFPGSEEFAILGGIYNFTPPSPQNAPAPENRQAVAYAGSPIMDSGTDAFAFNLSNVGSILANDKTEKITVDGGSSLYDDLFIPDVSIADAPIYSFRDSDFLFA